ncbi:ABC transporter substrate-binding protein [Microbacterium excoecariae]|uniref:ABC transporter substrate-binding protein n=1 Tax=Microbacterium excoecariae TaxID=2715210 RepID=UPI00140A8266|nr:sugar ABC transporter substrate-binding protein [Microbacterium excoecariae]
MKTRAGIAVAAVGALALTGCSSGSGGSDGGLVWSMWIGSTEDQAAWETVADAGAEGAGLDVTLQGAPFADYWTKLSTQLGTDAAPCIVSMQSLRVNQFVDGLLPLDDLMASGDFDAAAFDEGAMAALAYDDQQFAIPYDTGPLVMYYNRDALEAAGVSDPAPGWSVSDFEDAAAALADNDQVALATSVEDLYLEATLLSYNGTQLLSEDGTYNLSSPEAAEGVEWLAGLVADGYATRADGADATADDNAFTNGSAAMLVGGPWQLLDLNSKTDFEVGVATIPAGDAGQATYAAGSGFGISTTCDDPEAAFAAITAMTSADILGDLAEQGRAFPARTAEQQAWYDNSGVDGLQEPFDSALASAVPLPGSAQGDQFNQLLAQYGAQMVNGDRPAADVLADIASQLGG